MTEFKSLETAWIALNKLHVRAHRNIEQALQEANLPRLDWYDVLWALECAPDGLRPYQMQDAMLFEQSSFSRLTTRLEKDGLIERSKDSADGRGLVLKITDTGKKLRAKMWPVYQQAIAAEMEHVAEQGNDLKALLYLSRP
ncbi:MarR family winged helix-turn-helix transcriptional regulator [Halocynthiibacter sp.]|uniref:MarR family winged helix-turn-helix transcriptional regulator n=1 Tax=Halocynthiibacter sp. TaxID=1979210 RepID=UPI003C45A4DE